MCANYAPTRADVLAALTQLEADFGILPEVFPGQRAPLIQLSEDGELRCINSIFGLLPKWNKDPKFSRFTYNARSETAAEKPSFRSAWRKRQLALAPMQAFFEPCYETGKAVRWRIHRADQDIFFAASLWEIDAQGQYSHSLLTVNADNHSLMQRFHPAQDEKRSIVCFSFDAGLQWLADQSTPIEKTLTTIDPVAYTAEAAPLVKRSSRIAGTSLFD